MQIGNEINAPVTATVFDTMVKTGKEPQQIVKELGLEQISDSGQLEKIVADVIDANPKVVTEIKAGKMAGVQFLVGQVMKSSKGKANPKIVQEHLAKQLSL